MSNRQSETPASPQLDADTSRDMAFRSVAARFRDAGLKTPELDARLLLCHACNVSHEAFVADPDAILGEPGLSRLQRFVAQRLGGEPVSRIVGSREFYGHEFHLSDATLDPRPDTETLIEAALEVLASASEREQTRILDLGTGTGCILLSLLHGLPGATGIGTDISAAALEVARGNAEAMGLTDRASFMQTAWFEGIEGQFDLVVSNPPYIPSGEIDTLDPEVARFDPRAALDGGEDGLDAYRIISSRAYEFLEPGGWVVLEVGDGQGHAVAALLESEKFQAVTAPVRRWNDLAGHTRCVGTKRSPK